MDDIDGKFPDPYAIRPGAIEPDPILPTQFFWRRVFAICFDLVVATVVLQMLAVILFSMTAGRVQANNSFAFFMCDRLQKLPAGITVPESFKPNYAMACTKSLFGLPIGRFVTIGKVTQQGAATMNVGETFFVDVNGRPIDGWSIDWLLVPLFLLFKLGGEAISGRTAGKYITGLRVASASPGTIGIRSAVVRNSPTIANWLLSSGLFLLALSSRHQLPRFDRLEHIATSFNSFNWVAVIAVNVIFLLPTLIAAIQIFRDRLPYCDGWANTRVELVPTAVR